MVNSKEFEEKLQKDSFEELENDFQQTKSIFEKLEEKIKYDEVQLNYPAFGLCKQEIRIKFPTYKIRIIDNEMSHEKLREILKDIGNYQIYDESNVVIIPSFNPVKSTAIHCLESSLSENTKTAEKIEKKLNDNNVRTERCVTSGHYRIAIKVDKEGYIKKI